MFPLRSSDLPGMKLKYLVEDVTNLQYTEMHDVVREVEFSRPLKSDDVFYKSSIAGN